MKNAHNAGFDSLVKGCVFNTLCQKIMENGGSTSYTAHDLSAFLKKDMKATDCGIFGRNKVSIFFMLFCVFDSCCSISHSPLIIRFHF